MVTDPYKVLGITEGASKDEIKKAYRRKAKEYHPDLHPNDPDINKKMAEVNEAYDMLMNPEKYANRSQQQARSGQQQSNYNGQQGSYANRQGTYTSRNAGGWSADFGGFGFDFEDIFGFGRESTQEDVMTPHIEPYDSPEIQAVINAINSRDYDRADNILTYIPSTGRNARYYYLSALVSSGMGNNVQAIDRIYRAVQLEPDNRTYNQLMQRLRRSEQTYERNGRGFDMNVGGIHRVCFTFCAAQALCNMCSFCCHG